MMSYAHGPRRAARFTYGPLEVDEAAGGIVCNYDLDGRHFAEVVDVGGGYDWTPAAREAARLVHLLAGVSYYKAGAPPEIDLGQTVVRPGEREFLRRFYVEGLGEFSLRNGLPLDELKVVGGIDEEGPVEAVTDPGRPLVPFGGGIDSIVTVETVKQVHPGAALFIASPRGRERFSAIERAATVAGLPIVRVERGVDKALWSSSEPFFNGHVPVTGILSAIAALCAVLGGRGAVVMSNEWSASRGDLVEGGRAVNHQWSKSEEFEQGFRSVLNGALGKAVDYFSLLRPFSELWVAQRFTALEGYRSVVHSCNRAFHMDPGQRVAHWCGRCDKCCFIDLVLSPFMEKAALEQIFDGAEPLDDPTLLEQFRALLELAGTRKPFECVGDADECRSATVLAAGRADRASSPVLALLVAELGSWAGAARAGAGALLRPLGGHNVPDALFAAALR